MKKGFILGTCIAAVFLAFSLLPLHAQEPELKIGFVYVSPIGDAGWTYQHDLGRIEMEEALEGRVKTKYIESVPEGSEAERVIRNLAASGHDLIFTTSFGYMNPTLKVAKQFPNQYFEHATGYKLAPNMGNYMPRLYEGRYLTGIVAGKMTKSNVLGYIAAFPIPEVIRGINAYIIGARSVNPKAQVKVIWVNSWFDPGREREAAEALIAQGADVLTHHTDSTAAALTGEEKGVYVIAYHSDMSDYAPNYQLTAATHHWGSFYIDVAKKVMDKTWKSESVWGGIKEGMMDIAPFSEKVPKTVASLVEKQKKMIKEGTLHPFQGIVKDQSGKVRVQEGQVMSDDDLKNMDYYVEGIMGSIPK
jgi:simple sugar transport system substrate-binding protein